MLTKVSSEIGALKWLTTVCKYNITVYFERLTKQVSEIVLLPTIREPENAAMTSSLVTIATVYFGASGAYSMKVCLVTPIFQILFALKRKLCEIKKNSGFSITTTTTIFQFNNFWKY